MSELQVLAPHSPTPSTPRVVLTPPAAVEAALETEGEEEKVVFLAKGH